MEALIFFGWFTAYWIGAKTVLPRCTRCPLSAVSQSRAAGNKRPEHVRLY